MKKFILSAVAVGALAFGGAASAQDLGGVVSNILGSLGFPTQNYGYGTVLPGVVAPSQGTVYIDQYGRQVLVQPQANVYGANNYGGTTYGTTTSGVVAYDSAGRPLYRDAYGNYTYTQPYAYSQPFGGAYAYSGRTWDRDGDGIANARDRWPDDRRYF
jgi:hypothetical protein